MNLIQIIREELQGLNEDLNKISMQTAVDRKMFGPVYHGTTTENRENIEREGFKIFVGADRGENIRHGYPGERAYAQGTPPPIHHLGYGIYFTTVKTIAKAFNVNSGKGLKTYYLDVPKLATINFASPKRMMDWWLANGYDAELAKSGQQGRIDATKRMTETLMKNYDAVWFKGKTMYRVLDGDQIVVFNTNNIYQIDPALAGELEIGSKVRRTNDKFDYQYIYTTDSDEPVRVHRAKPTISKGTIGVIIKKRPTEEILQQWVNSNQDPSTAWFKDSKYIYSVKWNKGGTEMNALDKDIEPFKQKEIEPKKMVAEIVREEINEMQNKNTLKKILNSNEAYEILDNSKAGESTWCAGGCAILAFALNIVYGYPIYVIYDYDWKQIDHFIVKTPNNTYIDCDGEQKDIVSNFRKKEHYERPDVKLGILPYTQNLKNNGVPIDMEASQKLADLININGNINEAKGTNEKIPDTLWHLTTAEKYLGGIQQQGLNPEFAKQGGGEKGIYLTDDAYTAKNYAGFYNQGDKLVLLKVKTNNLQYDLFRPDDYELQDFLDDGGWGSKDRRIKQYDKCFDVPAELSLLWVNQVKYIGNIPKENLEVFNTWTN
jgi:hypothetical protein